jgi:hypothetical protein
MGKFGDRVGIALLIAAAALVPWLFLLSASLPHTTRVSGWSTAWVGLDVLEGLALVGTGLLVLRRDPRVSPVAAVAASLLLVDAWFDVTTAGSGRELALAVGMAVLVELPICVCCVLIAAGAVGIAEATTLLDVVIERASGLLAGRRVGVPAKDRGGRVCSAPVLAPAADQTVEPSTEKATRDASSPRRM